MTSCAFPVSVHFTVNRETAKTFTSGTTIITGPLFAEYSANGKSITLNESGPGKLTVSDGSVLFVGHGVGIGPLVTPDGLVLSYVTGYAQNPNLAPIAVLVVLLAVLLVRPAGIFSGVAARRV